MNEVVHSFLSLKEVINSTQRMEPTQLTASNLRFSSLEMFSRGAMSPTFFLSVPSI